MSATQPPHLRLAQAVRIQPILRGLALVATLGGALFLPSAGAQSLPASCTGAPSGLETVLSGRWVVLMQGWQGTGPGSPVASAFSFDASGNGSFADVSGGSGVTGNIDANFGAGGASSTFSGTILTSGSSYVVGLDPTNDTGYVGCMTLANSDESTTVLRFALNVVSGSAFQGRIIRWTDSSANGSGIRASGEMLPQDATAFSGGTFANLKANYVYGEDGYNPTGTHFSEAGAVTFNTANGQFSGNYDVNEGGVSGVNLAISGTFSGLSATTGRALITSNLGNSTVHLAMYIVNANELFLVGIDPFTDDAIYTGRAIVTGTTFSNSSLTGSFVTLATGSSSGNANCNAGANCSATTLGVLNFSGTGLLNNSSTLFNYQLGTAPQTIFPSGSYSVAASGRVTLPSGDGTLYLATPQPNTDPVAAFVVGTDSFASFGEIETGANANVSVSAIAGSYIFGSIDSGDSTVRDQTGTANIDSSGNITGYQFKSDTSNGLTDGPISGGAGSNILSLSNSPLPGIGSIGSGTFAVTNGARIWFIDTGTNNTSPAEITVIQPNIVPSGMPITPTVELFSSSNPSAFGQSVTFTALVFGSSEIVPTGTVTFLDGGEQINGPVTLSTGLATLTTSSLSAGSHTITAEYSGDINFLPATSNEVIQVVPSITATPAALIFGLQGVGTTSGVQTVTLSVLQGAGAVAITSTSFTGDFAQSTTDCGASISSGQSCHIGITFTPTAAGPRTGQLTVSTDNVPLVVYLSGNSVLRSLPGFATNVLPPNDDDSTNIVPLGFTANFFGNNYTGVYVNNNGNVTFDSQLSDFTPFPLAMTNHVIIAPFFADVDTEGQTGNAMANLVTYGTDTVNGHPAFAATWNNVGYYDSETDKLNTFQVVLVNRADVAAGDFDIEFNYDKIQWETGDASDGDDGLGGSSARAGYSNGTTTAGTFLELPGSAVAGSFLDSNLTTGLIHLNSSTSTPGRTLFQVRSGTVLSVNTVVLSPKTAGYTTGTQACVTATATDQNGAIVVGASVDFTVTGVNPTTGSANTSSNGQAQFCYTGTAIGTDTVTGAVGTISDTATVTWTAPALQSSTTALISSSNPSIAGLSVMFTATVSGSGGTPTGTVTFFDGINQLSAPSVSGGVAIFSTSSLAVGSHSITAQYSGDSHFLASTSNAVTQVVNAVTLTSITVTPNPSAFIPAGSTEQFTATGHYSDSSTQNLTVTATWNSSTQAAATIANAPGTAGLATGVAAGGTNITASMNGVTSPVVALTVVPAAAQSTDTSGTDFWLTFPQNLSSAPALSLFIAGNANTTGTVYIPGLSPAVVLPFSVTAGQVTTVTIPIGAQLETSDQVQNLGIRVTAQNNVTVYGLNHVSATTDGYLGLPNAILGTSYIVLGYQGGAGSQFALVGTANGTTVNITPSATVGSHTVGTSYPITLNEGQTYQLTDISGTDLTGTVITSNHPIAAFGGNQCTDVPPAYSACNYLVEELPPTTAWGESFFSVPLATRTNGDTFRFLASTNLTHVSVNGSVVATLSAGQFFEQIITTASQITADQPILVAQYSNSSSFDSASSDPFMMLVPPAAQYLASYTVTTPATGFAPNFVNVVAPTAGIGTINLDGTAIAGNLFSAIGSTGFSGAQVPLPVGSHTLTGVVPFGTIVYGYASFDGYGYAGGFSLSPIATVTTVALAPKTATVAAGTQACVTATVTDQNSAAVVGVRVDFTVTGANPTTGFTNTGNNGQAQFCYTGTLGGTDTVTGAVGTISDTATVNWTGSSIRPSATALASTLNPSIAGQTVMFVAPVNGSGSAPTGTVTFFDGETQLGTGTISGGQATFSTSSLAVGTHSITAVYGGNGNFSSSTSNVVSQVVNPLTVTNPTTPTFIVLGSSPNPAAVSAAVVITATVTGSGGTPTGTVSFLSNGVSLGVSSLSAGVASFSTTSLATGTDAITAQYFGDASFAGSFSSVLLQTVGTSSTSQVSVLVTPIPTNVASGANTGGTSTVQFTATPLNGGTNPTITWQQLTGPGSVSSSGLYTAPSTAPTTAVVTLVATVTTTTNQTATATVEFTIAADALTTNAIPQNVAPGGTVTATINLTGAPATGPTSTVPFVLTCANLPVGATCVFTNCATPPVVITSVTGANPCFNVSIKTSSGTTTTQMVPWPEKPSAPTTPAAPWYALSAVLLTALAMLGSRRQLLFGRMRYACVVLVLLSVSLAFLTSCATNSPQTVSVPVATSVTPPGNFQALVVATPQNTNGSSFVQTQLIVPFTVQ